MLFLVFRIEKALFYTARKDNDNNWNIVIFELFFELLSNYNKDAICVSTSPDTDTTFEFNLYPSLYSADFFLLE